MTLSLDDHPESGMLNRSQTQLTQIIGGRVVPEVHKSVRVVEVRVAQFQFSGKIGNKVDLKAKSEKWKRGKWRQGFWKWELLSYVVHFLEEIVGVIFYIARLFSQIAWILVFVFFKVH